MNRGIPAKQKRGMFHAALLFAILAIFFLAAAIQMAGKLLMQAKTEGTDRKETGLSGLTVSDTELKFDARLTEYAVQVGHSVSSVRVKAAAREGYSLQINGQPAENGMETEAIPMSVGYNLIRITAIRGEQVINTRVIVKRLQEESLLYQETYRPQFHNSTQIKLMNDPNGLVYNEATGEYHLFYQQDAAIKSGMETKCWAHAVSNDLVHWKELPLAIIEDDLGEIYSGSAVIDRNNTSGLFDESTPSGGRMVALFTYYSGHEGDSEFGIEKQGLAYSTDNGLTWIKYSGNPVIKNGENFKQQYTTGFRDPKVFWYEDDSYENGGIWMMVVAGAQVRLFTSPDLLHWTYQSVATYSNGRTPIVSECPDLFPMAINGDANRVKWVFCGSDYNNGDSSIFYVVGDIHRTEEGLYRFIGETRKSDSINGNNEVYAAQTFFNDPKGRRISISWIRDWVGFDEGGYSVKNWLGTHTLPVELSLVTDEKGEYRMRYALVEEAKLLRQDTPLFHTGNRLVSSSDGNILEGVQGQLYDVEAIIALRSASEFGFRLRMGGKEQTVIRYLVEEKQLVLDRSQSGDRGITNPVYTMTMEPLEGDRVKLRILSDTSIVDVYGNEDQVMVNTQIYPSTSSTGMEFYVTGGEVTVESLEIYPISSIWSNWQDPYVPGNLIHPDPDGTTQPGSSSGGILRTVGLVAGALVLAAAGVALGLLIARKKPSA